MFDRYVPTLYSVKYHPDFMKGDLRFRNRIVSSVGFCAVLCLFIPVEETNTAMTYEVRVKGHGVGTFEFRPGLRPELVLWPTH